MTTGDEDYGRHTPDALLQVFSRSRIVYWCLVAVGIHAVVLVATSTGYIRDRWIDPEGAKMRIEAAAAAVEAAKHPAGVTNTVALATNATAVTEAAAPAAGTESGTGQPVVIDGVTVPEGRSNAPIIKAITETAKPPVESDLGISLDDTRTP